MTKKTKKIVRLKKIAELIKERDFSELSQASAACEQTRDDLAALERSSSINSHFSIEAALTQERYALQQLKKRYILNHQLAHRLTHWEAVRKKAQLAFARTQALQHLLKKDQSS